jgi:uncharacterized protein
MKIKQIIPLICVSLGVTLSSQAFAIDAAKKPAVDALLSAMNVTTMADTMAARMKEDLKMNVSTVLEGALVAEKKLSNEQKKALVPKLEKVIPTLQAKVGSGLGTEEFKKTFINEHVNQYDKAYSKTDIEALTGFFQSAVGKKFLEAQGKVSASIIQNLQAKYMPSAIDELKKMAVQEVSKAAAAK